MSLSGVEADMAATSGFDPEQNSLFGGAFPARFNIGISPG
jgi:hypothetical protein